MKLLVFGGRQRGPINLGRMREWRLYDQARIVELRFFAGLSIEETAAALAISPATVRPVFGRIESPVPVCGCRQMLTGWPS